MSIEPGHRACGAEHGIGDALRMLRHLGRPAAPLTPVERRTLAEVERRCATCPMTAACGLFLMLADPQADPPPFCPNAGRLRLLLREEADRAA